MRKMLQMQAEMREIRPLDMQRHSLVIVEPEQSHALSPIEPARPLLQVPSSFVTSLVHSTVLFPLQKFTTINQPLDAVDFQTTLLGLFDGLGCELRAKYLMPSVFMTYHQRAHWLSSSSRTLLPWWSIDATRMIQVPYNRPLWKRSHSLSLVTHNQWRDRECGG
jgi:hypothetical protein